MRIKLIHVNLVLWIGILILAASFWDEILWARVELPKYTESMVPPPDILRVVGPLP